jgi:hypothetical protein
LPRPLARTQQNQQRTGSIEIHGTRTSSGGQQQQQVEISASVVFVSANISLIRLRATNIGVYTRTSCPVL